MKNNKGSVKAVLLVLGGLLAVFVLLGSVFGISMTSFYNTSISQENGIKGQYEQNKNNYDNYFKKLKEAAQVTEMYSEDMQKLYAKVVEGREGSDQELVRFIKEQNPQLDPSIYVKIQQIIESGRNSFEADQKSLIDKKQAYETTLQTFPNNMLAPFLGLPKINLAEYKIVTSVGTKEAFEKGEAEPINLRK